MKTAGEQQAEAAATANQTERAQIATLNRWLIYIDKIEAKGINPYVLTRESGRGNFTKAEHSERVRTSMRAQIRAAANPPPEGFDLAALSGLGYFIDTACDTCGTALFDDKPNFVAASIPPKFGAACVGCGRTYSLPTTLRTEAQIHPGMADTYKRCQDCEGWFTVTDLQEQNTEGAALVCKKCVDRVVS